MYLILFLGDQELYEEIDKYLPKLKVCLAPKKAAQKTGAQSLRSGVSNSVPVSMDEAAIKEAAGEVFDWLDDTKKSKIRMLHTYQANGGLPFVAHVLHRSVQCFKKHGEAQHATGKGPVSKETFVAAVVCRHAEGSGIFTESESKSSIDFESTQ